MKITLTNNFHSTSINLILRSSFLSNHQMQRAKNTLCPSHKNGCVCSGVVGMRGEQTAPIVGQEHHIKGLVPRFSLTKELTK